MAGEGVATAEGATSTLQEAWNRRAADQNTARTEAMQAHVKAGARPIDSRDAEQRGMFYPHQGIDSRHTEMAGSLQIPLRQQAAPAPEIKPEEGLVVSRSELVVGVTTGESMKHNRRLRESPIRWLGIPIEDRQRLETGEAVLMQPETVRKATNFLRDYVQSWNRIASQDAPGGNMLDFILQNPAFAADKALLDRISVIQGDNVRGVVSDQEIRDFLSNSSAWGEVMTAINRFTLLSELGQGMEMTVKNKLYNRPRDDSFGPKRIISDEDFKTIRSMIKSGVSSSATTMGALTYYLGGGKGQRLYDIDYRSEIVRAMQEDMSPEDMAIFRAFTGIDIDNLGTAGLRPTAQNNAPTYSEAIQLDMARANNLRKDILVTLGLGEHPTHGWFTKDKDVDRSIVGTLQQHIYQLAQGNERGYHGSGPEGSRFVTDVRVMQEYNSRYRAWVVANATGANPQPTPPELVMLGFLGEALQTVRNEFARDRLEVERRQKEERAEADSLIMLDAKRTAMDSEDFRKNRIDRALDRKSKAETAKQNAESRRTTLETALGASEIAYNKKQAELLSQRFGVLFPAPGVPDIDTAVANRITDLEGAGGEIEVLLGTPVPGYATLRDAIAARDADITAQEDAIRTGWQATQSAATRAVVAFPQAAFDAVAPRIEAQFAARFPELGRLEELRSQVSGLRAKHQEFIDARDALEGAVLGIRAQSRETNPVSQAEAARTAVNTAPPAGPGLSFDQINDFSVQQIADALRGVAPLPPPATHPWGTTDADRQRYAMQAKVSEEVNRKVALNGYQAASVTFLAGLGTPINIDDALRMPLSDVADAIVVAGGIPAAGIPGPGGIVIPAATPPLEVARWARQAAIEQRRQFEHASVNQEIRRAEDTSRAADAQLENLRNLEDPKAQVDVARAVLRRAADGSLYSSARTVGNIPRGGIASREDSLVTELGNAAPINAADTRVTDAERESGYAQGLLEWYKFLYPGYQDASNRQELFNGFMRDLPPRRLAEIISTELGFTGIPANLDAQEYVRRVLVHFGNRSRGTLVNPRPTQAEMIRIIRTMVGDIRAAGAAA